MALDWKPINRGRSLYRLCSGRGLSGRNQKNSSKNFSLQTKLQLLSTGLRAHLLNSSIPLSRGCIGSQSRQICRAKDEWACLKPPFQNLARSRIIGSIHLRKVSMKSRSKGIRYRQQSETECSSIFEFILKTISRCVPWKPLTFLLMTCRFSYRVLTFLQTTYS